MLNKRGRIIAIVVIVFFAALFCLASFYSINPSLPQWEKEKIKQQHERGTMRPLVWYDENGCVETDYVYRYIGTYGDCYAILEIGDNRDNGTYFELELPYLIRGLSKNVYYPVEADIMLYHTKKAFTHKEIYGYEGGTGEPIRFTFLRSITNREDWISDEMFEQLIEDIDIIAKEHNFGTPGFR